MQFWIDCIPPKTTAQQKQIVWAGGKRRLIDRPQVTQTKHTLHHLLVNHAPEGPFTGPLHVTLTWRWPYRKSDTQRTQANEYIWHDKRPDCDNLAKSILDVMSTLQYWNDDAQIAQLTIEKQLGHRPGIGIQIRLLRPLA